MRSLAITFVFALTATAAQAQNADLDRLRLQMLQEQNMRAQEQDNLQRRYEADRLQSLADEAYRQGQTNLRAITPSPAYVTGPVAALPPPPTADDDALRRLQERELAASNARLLAITPAP